MMRRTVSITLAFFLLLALPAAGSAQPVSAAFRLNFDLGKKALDARDYNNALYYFKRAQTLNPQSSLPGEYINLIKRVRDDRVSSYPFRTRPSISVTTGQTLRQDAIDAALNEMEDVYGGERVTAVEPLDVAEKPDFIDDRGVPPPVETIRKREPSKQDIGLEGAAVPLAASPIEAERRVEVVQVPDVLAEPDIIFMDDELWTTQPRTVIQLELHKTLILEGNQIERFLVITPGYVAVDIIDRDHFKVTGQKRGSTIVHVWDARGRWTFTFDIIMPISDQVIVEKVGPVESARPLQLRYIADWNSFYRGDSFNTAERENLNFFQRLLLDGETPYGDVDGFILWTKFDSQNVVTGYGYGLSDGRIGTIEDFWIRGGDIRMEFSPLTLSGQTVRGLSMKSQAFQNRLEWSYIRGKDRSVIGFLPSGATDTRDSYIEGFRLLFFPHADNQYAINFARGFGEARRDFLKKRVASVQTLNTWENWVFRNEIAYDNDVYAATLSASALWDQSSVFFKFRNIDEEYTTIVSLPANRGEIGLLSGYTYRFDNEWVWDSILDLYEERFMNQPGSSGDLNLNLTTSLDIPFNPDQRLRTSMYYIDTPGELSPRENFRLHSTYSHRFEILDRWDTAAFIGGTYQRSRFEQSPSSEYDRYSVLMGSNTNLTKALTHYWNYEYSLVDDKFTGDTLRPHVFTTGLSYTRNIAHDWDGNVTVSYRNEENTGGLNSFLSGEDSVSASLGATYRPTDDVEFFADGRMRNVWAENNERQAFHEFDIRFGFKMALESPWAWNPVGTVQGYVFKDLNMNLIRDSGEEGIAQVDVMVGDKKLTTDAQGFYRTKIRAKAADVRVDMNTIPKGFIFTTPVSRRVEIVPHRIHRVNFGLSTQSNIYGIVFWDANGNGKPDGQDKYLSGVVLTLDGEKLVESDFEGTYTFRNVAPGRHAILIDINSLPMEYLPTIPVRNEVTVEEGSTYVFHVPLKKKASADDGGAQ